MVVKALILTHAYHLRPIQTQKKASKPDEKHYSHQEQTFESAQAKAIRRIRALESEQLSKRC